MATMKEWINWPAKVADEWSNAYKIIDKYLSGEQLSDEESNELAQIKPEVIESRKNFLELHTDFKQITNNIKHANVFNMD